MERRDKQILIHSQDYWFKIVEFLQQNWALIDRDTRGDGYIVYFISDSSGVFDQMRFSELSKAELALKKNGFNKFAEDKDAQKFIASPRPPFFEDFHPNGPIYSSGKFWR